MKNFAPASRLKRFLASMLDSLILTFILLPLLLGITFSFDLKESVENNVFMGVYIVSAFLYFTLMEQSSWRATLGKKCFGLYVSDIKGNKITILRSILRQFLYFFQSFPVIISSYVCPNMTLSEHIRNNNINDCFVILLISYALAIILLIIWFAPILFKSRRGVHDRLSGTYVHTLENINSKQ